MTSSPSWITVAPSRPAEGSSDGAPPGFPGRAPGSRASHLGNIQTALLGESLRQRQGHQGNFVADWQAGIDAALRKPPGQAPLPPCRLYDRTAGLRTLKLHPV